MKILFLSQRDLNLKIKGIYTDLVNALADQGHSVTLCCADHKYEKTYFDAADHKLCVKVANQFGVGNIQKGWVFLTLERRIIKAIKKHIKHFDFDLVLYATPPITFANIIKYCKKIYRCKSYLMLKDIFPQNALDINIMSDRGILGVAYRLFQRKEKKLYAVSDRIGCMSKGNAEYLLKHNAYLDPAKVEIFPNAIKIEGEKDCRKNPEILEQYEIPANSKVKFIYGGNLGKPQGLDFMARAIKECADIDEAYFVIVGNGGEKEKLFSALKGSHNVKTINHLPKDEYEKLCDACDIGMIMLDHRFTIPNYPSRILSYLESAMPVFACTDLATDVRRLVEKDAKCGKWCYSNNIDDFKKTILWFVNNKDKFRELGEKGREYLLNHFNIEDNVKKLENFMSEKENGNV